MNRSLRLAGKARRRIRRQLFGTSELDMIIPAEVVDDAFSRVITRLVSEPSVKSVLEIGSSTGAGSTSALVAGMVDKLEKSLYCIELSRPRFVELSERFKNLQWVDCINLPSVDLSKMPTAEDVESFFVENPSSALSLYGIAEVQRWLVRDRRYVENNTWSNTGIAAAKERSGLEVFDVVLIDGCEFTGEAELNELIGSGVFLLDDSMTFKNFRNVQRLLREESYELVERDDRCRNGFAAFRLR